MDTSVCYLIQILHHIKQFEKIIAKEKKPNTLFFLKLSDKQQHKKDYKVKRGLIQHRGVLHPAAAEHRSAASTSRFMIRDECIYFVSSLACSWVVARPGQREGRSGEQLHVNRLEMTQIP